MASIYGVCRERRAANRTLEGTACCHEIASANHRMSLSSVFKVACRVLATRDSRNCGRRHLAGAASWLQRLQQGAVTRFKGASEKNLSVGAWSLVEIFSAAARLAILGHEPAAWEA